ncbi:MAG: hypothetical protein LUH22_11380 [Bacteroides sp.]|nr:hypothetical protein [Bacteroides sp.]
MAYLVKEKQLLEMFLVLYIFLVALCGCMGSSGVTLSVTELSVSVEIDISAGGETEFCVNRG